VKVDVVLPAGGRIYGEFAIEAGAEVKALISFNGKTVLEHSIETLRDTDCIGRIVVVGPDEIAAHPAAKAADVVLSEGGDSGPANIIRGLEWLHSTDGKYADRVLIVATDLPFLTPEAIVKFIGSCDPEADFCVPLVRREEFESRFPGAEIEYVHLVDGQWTMGCAFLVNPEAVIKSRSLIENIFSMRKSQLGMVRILGLGFILRFLFGRLTVAHIEKRCNTIIKCKGRAIYASDAALAYDMDKPDEYKYAVNAITV